MRRYLDKFPTAAAPSTHFQPSKELSRGSTHNLDCWCKYQHEPKPTSSWFSDPSMMKNHQQWLERGVRTILPHYQDCLAGPSPVKWLCILRSHRLLPFVFFFFSQDNDIDLSLEPTPVTPLVTKTFRFPLRRCLWSPESRVWTLTKKRMNRNISETALPITETKNVEHFYRPNYPSDSPQKLSATLVFFWLRKNARFLRIPPGGIFTYYGLNARSG